jgi:hypothetical protein
MLRLYRPLLVAGLTAGLLATGAMQPASAQSGPPDYATQANAPLDVNVFYDQLGQYGTWVQHPDYQYVFIPANVGPDWRPYQEGRWVWTDQYGWYWESYEPFGWATYHYGRWGYDPSYGWFWVPGDTWSPAWVTWRRGGGRTGWAPIAPDRPGYAVGRANYYAPPVAESWVFVEDRYMAEQDLAVYVAPVPQTNVYLAAAPDYYEPSWDNGYYVNRGFGSDVYDGRIRDRLYTRDVVFVENRDDVFYGNGQLGIFAPAIAMGGNRYGPPPRYERRLDPGQRAVIRQYVDNDRDTRGVFAPSAALLNVLDANQRRDLRQARFNQPDMYRQQVQQFEQQRAARLDEMRRNAMARNAQIAAQQQQLNDQRRAQADQIRQQYLERAQRLQGNPGMQPGYRPAVAPGGPPNAPNAAQQEMLQRQRAQQQQQEQFRAQQLQNQQQAGEAQRRAIEQQQLQRAQQQQQQQQVQQERAQQAQQLRAQQQQQAVEAQRRAAEQQQQIQQQRAAQQQAVQQQRAAQQQAVQQQRAAQQEKAQQAQQQRAAQQQAIQQQRAAQQQAVQQQRAAQQQAVQQQRAAQQQQRAQQMQQMRGQQPPPQQPQPQQPPPRRPGSPDPNQPPAQ